MLWPKFKYQVNNKMELIHLRAVAFILALFLLAHSVTLFLPQKDSKSLPSQNVLFGGFYVFAAFFLFYGSYSAHVQLKAIA